MLCQEKSLKNFFFENSLKAILERTLFPVRYHTHKFFRSSNDPILPSIRFLLFYLEYAREYYALKVMKSSRRASKLFLCA
ncbi:MAG TPA: hypothetical protein DCP92_09930 [Nitrospiraceae bacterium]|nr:hypothetical protein [Nitrospiraceae bacterium]